MYIVKTNMLVEILQKYHKIDIDSFIFWFIIVINKKFGITRIWGQDCLRVIRITNCVDMLSGHG